MLTSSLPDLVNLDRAESRIILPRSIVLRWFWYERREQAGSLPTVADFAGAIANVCGNSSFSSGETIFVGNTEW